MTSIFRRTQKKLNATVIFRYYANNSLIIHIDKCEIEGEFISLGLLVIVKL